MRNEKPKRATFTITLYDATSASGMKQEERTGYVLGDWTAHKDLGKGVYFWTISHRPTGVAMLFTPETKAEALAKLEELHVHGIEDWKMTTLATFPRIIK